MNKAKAREWARMMMDWADNADVIEASAADNVKGYALVLAA